MMRIGGVGVRVLGYIRKRKRNRGGESYLKLESSMFMLLGCREWNMSCSSSKDTLEKVDLDRFLISRVE